MLKLNKVLLFLFLFLLNLSLSAGPTEAPIKVVIDESLMKQLTPEQKVIAHQIVEAIEKNLTHWENYPIELPNSLFSNIPNNLIVNMGDLFLQGTPDKDEVRKLAYDESTGERHYLSTEQLKQIREEGLFVVPSLKYKGFNHLWKVSLLLQKGKKDIEISHKKDLSDSLEVILVTIPADIKGNHELSIKKGLKNIYEGVRGILSTTVGLSETKRLYSDAEIQKKIKEIKDHSIMESLHNNSQIQFDDRLYNGEVQKQIAPILERIERESRSDWDAKSDGEIRDFKAELRDYNIDEESLKLLQSEFTARSFDTIHDDHLLKDSELESTQAGIAQLIVNQRRALRISMDIERSLQKMVERYEQNCREEYIKNHPYLSYIAAVTEKAVKEQTTAYYHSIRWEYLQNIPEALSVEGLKQEAYIWTELLHFQKNQEEKLIQQFQEQRTSANSFNYNIQIWNPQNWSVETYNQFDNEKEKYYRLIDTTKKSVSTDFVGWRLVNAYYIMNYSLKNGLYQMIWNNMIQGPYGLRATFSTEDKIYPFMKIDRDGKLVVDSDDSVTTLRGKIQASIDYIRESREKFENSPDDGLLGKTYTRVFNKIWNYGFRGLLGIPLSTGWHIGATLTNVTISSLFGLTSPVWAPMSALFVMGFDTLVYDTHNPGSSSTLGHTSRSVLPFWGYTIGSIGMAGIGQTLICTAKAVVIHPLMAGTYAGYAEFHKWARTAYDAVAFRVFHKLARIPAEDTFTATRTAGPGVSFNYFYQIKPEIALLALEAQLEQIELDIYSEVTRSKMERPLEEYRAYLNNMVKLFGHLSIQNQTSDQLSNEKINQISQLNKAISDKKEIYGQITRLPIRRELIRQNKVDLERTLKQAEIIVESFFRDHLNDKYDRQLVLAIWDGANLNPGDFKGLTSYLFGQIFDPAFLTSLEENDENYIISIEDKELSERLKSIFPEVVLQ